MNEENINTREERYNNNPHIENQFDYQLHLSNTCAKDELNMLEMNKDLILSNLQGVEVDISRDLIDLIRVSGLFNLKKTQIVFTSRLLAISNTARARDGFERINQNTQRQIQDTSIKENNGNSRFWRRNNE